KKVMLAAIRALTVAGLCLLPAAGLADAHTNRGHHSHGRPHVRFSVGGYYGFGYSYWNSSYYGYYGYYPGYPGYYGPGYAPDVAFIDTDVQPEETAVYLDDEYAGTVDDFDGFPDYLAVRPGRHTLTFKAEGHTTVTRSVKVPRGAVLQVDLSLEKGTGVDAPTGEPESGESTVPESETGDRTGEERPPAEVVLEEDQEEGEPGFIRLNVTPPDASVYMDGEFVGTASRVSRLHGDLRLAPGEHRIEVVRPGYRAVSRMVKVVSGDHRTIDLELERNAAAPEPR
ncbi:MAG TPA: PEGA domain-containing protein, partial [Thermoplasmata archaeon]|nr:PEGA domain-containing protein [Thermoplasmata archaeon]